MQHYTEPYQQNKSQAILRRTAQCAAKLALLGLGTAILVACGGGNSGAALDQLNTNPTVATATITQVTNDDATPNVAIPADTSTTDTTPKVAGTISAALGTGDAVRVYAGATLLGTTTTMGTDWVFTGGTVLAAGTHVLKAVVYDASIMKEGSNTNSWSITVTGAAITSKLPHSGITASQCYSAGSNTLMACSGVANDLNPQQDGHRAVINTMSYSKVGFSGEALASTASSWCAVKDNVTGLLWQNHQATPATFTNWGDNREGDASKFAADNATLCGQSGWRLPTVDELQSIVDYSKFQPGPTINTTWFSSTPNTPGTWYLASLSAVGISWNVSFNDGGVVSRRNRGELSHVRLVLASQ